MDSPLNRRQVQELKDVAIRLRINSIAATQISNSGHPTSCSSIAEIITVLFFNVLRLDLDDPRDPSSDRLILSKGHAAPILYAAWAEAKLFPVENLLSLRKIHSDFEGHPTPRLNFVDVATGSLGQGLAVAAGMAYVGKYFDKAEYRVYVIVGDGESAEGSIWESLSFASTYKLDNLCVIFDINRLGQSDPTALQHQMDVYQKRVESFGFNAIVLDGHNVLELSKGFQLAQSTKCKPTALICRTIKGKYFNDIEDKDGWHGKPLGANGDLIMQSLKNMITGNCLCSVKVRKAACLRRVPCVNISNIKLASPPAYKIGDLEATRCAYGTALAKIAQDNGRVIALDCDTKNSTFSEKIISVAPERFIECFIAEQNMVGVAIGAACRDRTVVFASTFAAFFTRAFDQIRMGAISQTNVNFVGSHCGVSIGEDGPSQMGLEDIALFRSIPGSTVFYPSDAVSTERAIELAANTKGICYIRTSRPVLPVLYNNDEVFEIGKGKVVKESPEYQVLLIGACVTLFECLKAARELEEHSIPVCVIDPFTVKPLDVELILSKLCCCNGNGRVVVVEDHYQCGGLGEAVLSALATTPNFTVRHLYVPAVPRSGQPDQLLNMYGVSANQIVDAVCDILNT